MDPTRLPTRLPPNILTRWKDLLQERWVHLSDQEDEDETDEKGQAGDEKKINATTLAHDLGINRAQLSRVLNGHGADIVAFFFGEEPNPSGKKLLEHLDLTPLHLSEHLYAWLALDSRRLIEPSHLTMLDPQVRIHSCSPTNALSEVGDAKDSWHPLSEVLRWCDEVTALRHAEISFVFPTALRVKTLTKTLAEEHLARHTPRASPPCEPVQQGRFDVQALERMHRTVKLELSLGTAQEMFVSWAGALHEAFILNTERYKRLRDALTQQELVRFLNELSVWVSEPARCLEIFCQLIEGIACGQLNLDEPQALYIRLEALLHLELEHTLTADLAGDEERALLLRWLRREAPRFFQGYLREAGGLATPLDALKLETLVRGPRAADDLNADWNMLAEQVLASAALFGQDSHAFARALDSFAHLFEKRLFTALQRARWFIEAGSSCKLSPALVDLGRLSILRALSERPEQSWFDQPALWRREPHLMMHVIRRTSAEMILRWVEGVERMTPARWRLDAQLTLLDALAWRADCAALLDAHEPLRTLWARTLLAWACREAAYINGASDEQRLYEAIQQFSSQHWGVVLLEVGAQIGPEQLPLEAREAGPLDSLAIMCGQHNPNTSAHREATELLIWLTAMHLWPAWGETTTAKLIEAMTALDREELREVINVWRGSLLESARRGDPHTAALILTAAFYDDWELSDAEQLELLQHTTWPLDTMHGELNEQSATMRAIEFAETLIEDALRCYLNTDTRDDQTHVVLRAVLERHGELTLIKDLKDWLDELMSSAESSSQTLSTFLDELLCDDDRRDNDRLLIAYMLVMGCTDALRKLASLHEDDSVQQWMGMARAELIRQPPSKTIRVGLPGQHAIWALRFERVERVVALTRSASRALALQGSWREGLRLLSRKVEVTTPLLSEQYQLFDALLSCCEADDEPLDDEIWAFLVNRIHRVASPPVTLGEAIEEAWAPFKFKYDEEGARELIVMASTPTTQRWRCIAQTCLAQVWRLLIFPSAHSQARDKLIKTLTSYTNTSLTYTYRAPVEHDELERLSRLAPLQARCAHEGWDQPELDSVSHSALCKIANDRDEMHRLWPALGEAARRLALETITAVGPDDQQWWARAQQLPPAERLGFARRHNADERELVRAAHLVLDEKPNAASWWKSYACFSAAERPKDEPTLRRKLDALVQLARDDNDGDTQLLARRLCGVLIRPHLLAPMHLRNSDVQRLISQAAHAYVSLASDPSKHEHVREQLVKLWESTYDLIKQAAQDMRQAQGELSSLWLQLWSIIDQPVLNDILHELGWSSHRPPVPPFDLPAPHLTQSCLLPTNDTPSPGCVSAALRFGRRAAEDESFESWRERIGATIRSAPDAQREDWLTDLDNASQSSCDAETFTWIVGLVETLTS